MEVLRIVLLGKCGVGKSSSGNTLLGSKAFHTAPSPRRVTQACSMSISTVDGHKLHVVDTPGWIDISLTEDETTMKIIKSIDISDPGPHVLLLVLPIGRFTKEESDVAKQILKVFGEEAIKYMMVLFTKGDDLEEKTIEEYLTDDHPDLKKVIEICEGRYHVFNNGDKENLTQVSTLLEKIKAMVEKNEGKHYTKAMFQKTAGQMEDKHKIELSIQKIKEEAIRSSEGKGENNRGDAKKRDSNEEPSQCEIMQKTLELESKLGCKSDSNAEDKMRVVEMRRHKEKQKWQEKETELQRIIENNEVLCCKRKGELEKEIYQLQKIQLEQKNELQSMKRELQQHQNKVDHYMKLFLEFQQQMNEVEQLRGENDEEREKMMETNFKATLQKFFSLKK